MSEQQKWTHTGSDGDKHTFSYNVAITYKISPEAERERDGQVMAYLRRFGEIYKGPFSTDPVALCDLWAKAWMVGHGEGWREGQKAQQELHEAAEASRAVSKRKSK